MKIPSFITKLFFGVASFLFTLLVFLNTYEVVANENIPYATSLRQMTAQNVIDKVVKEFAVKLDSRQNNNRMDTFDYIEIPSLDIKVYLEEARKIDNSWYQRPSFAHYISLNKDSYGNSVDYLIYTSKSWRTIPNTEDIYVDTEIKVHTKKGFTFPFFVDEKMDLPMNKSFIVNKSENRQILLLVEDPNKQQYTGFSLTMRR